MGCAEPSTFHPRLYSFPDNSQPANWSTGATDRTPRACVVGSLWMTESVVHHRRVYDHQGQDDRSGTTVDLIASAPVSRHERDQGRPPGLEVNSSHQAMAHHHIPKEVRCGTVRAPPYRCGDSVQNPVSMWRESGAQLWIRPVNPGFANDKESSGICPASY